MDKLDKIKAAFKGKITRIETFLKDFKESDTSFFELSVKLESVKEMKIKFVELQEQYFELPPKTDLKGTEDDLQEIDARLENVEVSLSFLLNKITVNSNKDENVSSNENSNKNEISLKLPEIALPKFDGKYDSWNVFKNQFDNLISDNKQLTDSQKLFYLHSSLIGDAKQIESKNDSFSSLFKALEDRYNNKRAIVESHINAIMNYEKIQYESYKDLRSFLDCINKNLRALKLLDYESDKLSEIMLVNIILRKIDKDTRKLFELSIETKEVPSLESVLSFIEKRSFVIENMNRNISVKPRNFASASKPKALIINRNENIKCILCKEQHFLNKCTSFKSLDVQKRYEFVRNHKLCLNCLKKSHLVSQCKSNFNCLECNEKHNTLLCRKRNIAQQHLTDAAISIPIPSSQTEGRLGSDENALGLKKTFIDSREKSKTDSAEINSFQSLTNVVNKKCNILLSTAIIYVEDSYGVRKQCRAILDNGSQINLITTDLANALGLKKEKIFAPVSGINGQVHTIKKKVLGTISNSNETFKKNLDFLVVNKITENTPSTKLDISEINLPFLELADPEFFKPTKINILIGVEFFFEIIKAQTQKISDTLLLKESVFGYLVAGSLPTEQVSHYCFLTRNDENLEQAVERFWKLESVEVDDPIPSEELKYCDEHFKETHYRTEDGRYVVQMPFKEKILNESLFGDSKSLASVRLTQLWKRLERDPKMKLLYSEFMQEYEELNHMKETIEPDSKAEYFLPHHGVYRPQSSSTKLRVVFNASAKTTNGKSLNDLLLKGGIIQEDIFSIMTRFRKHTYAFSADIEKMFRQILIHPDQTCMQKILWQKNIDDKVRVYNLQTVTYGTSCAPYLATRTLQQLALDEGGKFPLAAAAMDDFYMDDCLSGSSDLQQAKTLRNELIQLLSRGGMTLHKWCSNHPDLQIGDKKIHPFEHSSEEKTVKTLGIQWNTSADSFYYKVCIDSSMVFTKRSVLSQIARIYDPLGLIGPVISKAKIFLQRLWLLKIAWHDTLPQPVALEWQKFVSLLPSLENVKISRCVLTENPDEVIIHGFADASESAFGAVIYLQCVYNDGSLHSALLCSKSRVAPIKTMTIPRLELSACLLLAQLVQKCLKALKLNISNVLLWSDSTIALAWIESSPHLLKTFVSNRVVLIQQLSQTFQWQHVPSQDNPADLISRGLSPKDLLKNELRALPDTNLNLITKDNFIDTIVNLTNNFPKLIRIVSFIFRFTFNARNPNLKRVSSFTASELKESENYLIKEIQKQEFSPEIKCLSKGKMVPSNSKLKSLAPFLDNDDLIRVGGRLQNSSLGFDQKHPILLPANHKLTKLLIENIHEKTFHIGPQSLLYLVREKFWPINGRNICRQICHDCVICFKAKPTPAKQLMGNLPLERVTQNFVFNICGIDFCGPFLVKYKNQRKGIVNKVYVAIFICFTTRAIHLEVVTDLTTQSFLASLKRFFARRGKCQKLFTDNAKTFVGANKELKRLHNIVKYPDEILATYLSSEGIDWNFIPPRAPNFGGLWEAGVKSFKHHLKRVVGETRLTLEELLTIVVQIEGFLNSRPLCPMSCDPNDFQVLSPGHFLIGRPITSIPEPSLCDVLENRLSRWQKISKFTEKIWKLWHKDYLSNLQQRNKWHFEKDNVKEGSVVLIKEDNLPPSSWLMGRIQQLSYGADGKVRVCTIKTKTGILKRAITKLALLPMCST